MGGLAPESAEIAPLVVTSEESDAASTSNNVHAFLTLSDILDAPPPSEITSAIQSIILGSAFHSHSAFIPSGCSDGANFCRDAQWCADGGSVLAVLEDASILVLDSNVRVRHSTHLFVFKDSPFLARLSISQAAPILSTAWFPSASPAQPASYCFVAGVRDGPVKLLDASDGRLRASYKIVDHRERFIAPHSMAFNMYMNKLYCGFEDAIEVFDVHYPGVEGTRLHTVPTKKSKDGLRGLISALAFAPDWSGLYAAGSYSGAIALYTEDTGMQAQGWLEGVPGGVTQIRFNPARPHVVHAAFRRTSAVASWDLRNPTEPIAVYDRGVVETNQRLRFDVSADGRWIVAGDERGVVSVFDVFGENHSASGSFEAHGDAIGAVAFHPTKPFIMSVSGSRHFNDTASENSISSDDSTDREDMEVMGFETRRPARGSLLNVGKRGPAALDSSLKLWFYEGI
ncbi:WD40 repeat-like protein [Ceratobasidium sp. AG-I]|nr:WD40 repeat-like protein [Ceratobasidium sp. AG-I]